MQIPVDLMGVILGLLLILAASLAWRASRSNASLWYLEDLFLDKGTQKASLGKLGQFCALSVSTWGFVYLTLAGALTEFYFVGYMIAWSGTNIANKWMDQRNKNSKENE